jgi:hypothetical protein
MAPKPIQRETGGTDMSDSEWVTEQVELNVYFNLIHNLLCNHFGIETFTDMERKSAYVRMVLPEGIEGVMTAPEDVMLVFGEHQIYFDEIQRMLCFYYDIPSDAEVEMTIPEGVGGELEAPVVTSMVLRFEDRYQV